MDRYFLDTKEKLNSGRRLAYQLSRPTALPETKNDLTLYTFPVFKHPSQEKFTASIPIGHSVPIHAFIRDSVKNGNGVSSYFDQFYSTPEEAARKKQLVVFGTDENENLLTRIKIIDLIPDYWFQNEKTYEELEADGWFPEP